MHACFHWNPGHIVAAFVEDQHLNDALNEQRWYVQHWVSPSISYLRNMPQYIQLQQSASDGATVGVYEKT
jgi:hypothetical protein